jgi:hypothetical protein
VRDIEAAHPGANVVLDLWDANLLLGTTRLMQDTPDEAGADQAFHDAIAIAPERPANPAQFPPDVVERFEAARKAAQGQAVPLRIEADGRGRAWVDGKDVGEVPATAPGVAPGVHYVLVRGEGTQGAQRVEVAAGATGSPSQVRVALSAPTLAAAASSAAGRSNQVAALYSALAKRATGVDYVLIGGVDGELLHLQLVHVASATFSKPMEIPFSGSADDEAAAAVPLLMRFVGPSGTFAATAPTALPLAVGSNLALTLLLTQPPEPAAVSIPGDKPRKSKTGLILGVVGAVVAGGAGTTAYLLTRPGETLPTTGTVTVRF